ncbi:MAG TPA: glycoside hydrolase family 2 TIM barrel-domain containing protein, partial [Opitutales bacterium]|nr:glycoside hydrolase family 2 TIM barrel-domain containing protein [Opitutales bacterium]
GGGLYRDVWLTKTHPIHVAQWGTKITTPEVSEDRAAVTIEVSVSNDSPEAVEADISTRVFTWDPDARKPGIEVLLIENAGVKLEANRTATSTGSGTIDKPDLWQPLPASAANLYVAVSEIRVNQLVVDRYETRFGIRSLEFNPKRGVFVNGTHVPIRGVNQHHDLGALGAAFNRRAAERQLEILRDMGCNAIRMAHNPPAPELLRLCDEMGFLVFNESFDVWERKKTGLGFHLIFPDWHEQDIRALVRRDRNHPSVIIWSTGNEVGEQYTDADGAAIASRLSDIVREEDPTRPTSASMNWAKPDMPFPRAMDLISLNYQGEGIRQDPIFEGTDRIRTPPMYPAFHAAFPDKVIVSSESASALSSRGSYLFPVTAGKTSPI